MDTEMDWGGEGGIFMQKERVWDSGDIYSAGPQDTAGVPHYQALDTDTHQTSENRKQADRQQTQIRLLEIGSRQTDSRHRADF